MSKRIALAMVVSLATTANAFAQATPGNPNARPAQPGQPGAAAAQYGSAGAAAGAEQLNQGIAACLLLGNEEEVALAKFAATRAKSDKVKEFVSMVQKDHGEAIQKLRRLAPQLAALKLDPNGAAANQTVAAGDIHAQMLALQHAVAARCLALTQRELGEHNGADFDMCFISQQYGAHVGMLAKLQGSEQFATGELRTFIQESTKAVEAHLQKAKELHTALHEEAIKGQQSAQRPSNLRQ